MLTPYSAEILNLKLFALSFNANCTIGLSAQPMEIKLANFHQVTISIAPNDA